MTEQKKARRHKRVRSLKTIQDCGIVMAQTFRQVARGELDSADGYRMVMMLAQVRDTLREADLVQRLAELEAQVARGTPTLPWKPQVVA
jgi:hypothetical protein